ncbi:hypothetical protein DENSPDRAFT_885475 [Dentipellis sp. KUC8613]|nr:hypothetical protein DENSPDRAFT_885475 [Dentipellis sp. KUC8613]
MPRAALPPFHRQGPCSAISAVAPPSGALATVRCVLCCPTSAAPPSAQPKSLAPSQRRLTPRRHHTRCCAVVPPLPRRSPSRQRPTSSPHRPALPPPALGRHHALCDAVKGQPTHPAP